LNKQVVQNIGPHRCCMREPKLLPERGCSGPLLWIDFPDSFTYTQNANYNKILTKVTIGVISVDVGYVKYAFAILSGVRTT